MKKFVKIICSVFAFALVSSFVFAEHAEPGTFENAAPAGLDKVLAVDAKLNPSKNELVVYYVRKDASYDLWALWMWAIPGGDGNSMWEYSQNWSVMDGIGYMRFPLDGSATGGNKPVSAEGGVGLIVRQKAGWIKDGNDDRLWNINTSNKVVIFERDQNTYAAVPYKPSIKSAELTSLDTIELTLSGKYALTGGESDSGFSVSRKNGKKFDIASVVNSLSSNTDDNYTNRVTIKLNEKASVSDSLIVSNPAFLGSVSVSSQKLAVKLAESAVPSADVKLGAEYANASVTFRLWAPTASSVTANLYKKDAASKADYTVPLSYDSATGVWSAKFSAVDPDGLFYDYTVINSKGTVNVLDPYAKSMAAYHNKGGAGRGAIVNLESQKALPEGGMDAPYYPLEQREDAVIYEVSVRDFTISADAGTKAAPGTYKAFIEKLPYLKELGVTHIQLMPVVNFYNNDETDRRFDDRGVVNGSNYNWGYDPHNYFTPEGWYATDATDPYCRVRELRELVNEIHKAGMGVLLDVVYNHMSDSALLDNIVPGYYFRMTDEGKFKSNSGCGNDTATERSMMKRIVVDSTKFWVEQYKVDGFRFDIMGLMEASSVQDSYNECARINPHVLFEGEAWKMYNGAQGTVGMDQNYMTKTNDIAAFNDEFRDLVKAGGFNETGLGLITGKAINTERLFKNATGTPTANYKADDPGDNLQYLVCHDGMTLHDLIVNNCHLSDEENAEEIAARIKLGNVIELTSQGIAFLHAGQERARTKPNVNKARAESINNFVRNSYDSSDNINQIVWNVSDEYKPLIKYTAGLIALRKSSTAFRLGDAKKIAASAVYIPVGEGDSLVFAYTIKNSDGTWLVAVNADKKAAKIKTKLNLKAAEVFVDKDTAGTEVISAPSGVALKGRILELEPLTATVIRVK